MVPGRQWIDRFIATYGDLFHSRRAVGLDPVLAQAFNPTAVKETFYAYREWVVDRGIKEWNIYNVDEKGIQLDGGRKSRKVKFFFPRDARAKYRLQQGDLTLVTVIACVSATGETVPIQFVFAGALHHASWYECTDDWFGG